MHASNGSTPSGPDLSASTTSAFLRVPGGRSLAWMTVALSLVSCNEAAEWSPVDGPWNPNHPEASAILTPPAPEAPIWTEMAEAGAHWYRVRGCLACHRTDGVDVAGPALNGVTRRRTYAWYRAMTLRPDSMLVHDPIAQELLAIYRVPMPVQRVNDLHVRAIWEYLREVDQLAAPPPVEAPAP